MVEVFVFIFSVVEHFDFEFAEEVFDDDVIVTVSFVGHGLDEVMVLDGLLVVWVLVLPASVGMDDGIY